MWHAYENVPACVKVREIWTEELLPVMSAGAPATGLKKTLWPTVPKAHVTVPPTAIVTDDGSKTIAGVAITVAVIGFGGSDPSTPAMLH